MKRIRRFSWFLTILGLALAAGTVWLALHSLDASPVLVRTPEEASRQAELVMDAIGSGDWAAAGSGMLGSPELGADHLPDGIVGQRMWSAFQDSISYEFTGECYATDRGLARDVKLTALDTPQIMDAAAERSRTLLSQRVEQAEDITKIYDAQNNYREEFVMGVLCDALSQTLTEEPVYMTKELTLRLTYSQGQWWVVPDRALLEILSGGTMG